MKASDFTVRLAARVARRLRIGPATKAKMVVDLEVSGTAIQRALTWLRREAKAPLVFDSEAGVWILPRDWLVPADRVGRRERVRAWMVLEHLRAVLETEDVVAAVENMIRDESAPVGDRACKSAA